MKPLYLVLIGILVLVSGDVFDTATTAVALVNPIFAGQFVEVGDPFIKLFMYDLGLATTGFFIAILISATLDMLIIYGAYSQSRSYTSNSFMSIVWFMIFLGILHWVAGYQNLMLLMSVAPFGL